MEKVKRIAGGRCPEGCPVGTVGELLSPHPLPQYGVKVRLDNGEVVTWDRKNCEVMGRKLDQYRDDKPIDLGNLVSGTAKAGPYAMSKDELFALHASTTAACLEVMKKKNHDYTSGGSVFANFKDSSILSIPPVMGVLLRCIDKFKRIQTHCTKGKLVVEGEGVLDAVDDVINYMILAKGMLIEESKNK